jgi:hypothetical protein
VRGAKVAAPRLREIVSSRGDPFLAVESLRSLIAIEGVDFLRPLLLSLTQHGSFMVADLARRALDAGAPPPPREGTR